MASTDISPAGKTALFAALNNYAREMLSEIQHVIASLKVPPNRRDILTYSLTFIPPLILFVIIGTQSMVPIAYLVKDPLAVAELTGAECCHVYYGLVSNVGIIMWCAAAAISLFAALALMLTGGERSQIWFLAAAGVFTGWLMLDDFFMVHEDVFPAFGVPQPVTYLVYAGLAGLYFTCALKQMIRQRFVMIFLAFAFLGGSVVIDVILHSESTFHMLTEDGAKLLGIAAWCAFHIDAALSLLSQQPNSSSSARRPATIVGRAPAGIL